MQVNIVSRFILSREFEVPDDIADYTLLSLARTKEKEMQAAFNYSFTMERAGFEWGGTEITDGDDNPILTIHAPYEDEEILWKKEQN